MKGLVVSTKLKNTATVLVNREVTHPLYKKTFARSKRYLVDDLIGVKDGDVVEIVKCKPVSKNKHWRIVSVIGKNLTEIIEAEQKKTAEKVIAEVMPEDKEESSEEVKIEEPKKKAVAKKEKK